MRILVVSICCLLLACDKNNDPLSLTPPAEITELTLSKSAENQMVLSWPKLNNTQYYQIFSTYQQQTELIAEVPASQLQYPITLAALTGDVDKIELKACDQQSCYRYAEKTNLERSVENLYCENQPQSSAEMLCLAELGVFPDTAEDVTASLQNAMNLAGELNKALFIPAGRYQISDNLTIYQSFDIVGEKDSLSIFDAGRISSTPILGNKSFYTELRDITISNMAFENVVVSFYGRKKQFQIHGNIFYNTKDRGHQLFVSHHHYQVFDNIFLRGKQFPGTTGYSFANSHVIVRSNFWGDLTDIPRASQMLSEAAQQRLQLTYRLRTYQNQPLDNFQSNYIRGWYMVAIDHGEMTGNFSTSSAPRYLFNPQTGENDIIRDHNIYALRYKHLLVTENYFSGWPRTAAGGLKFRNADTLYFAGNHVDNIDIITYAYSISQTILKQTYILNNHITSAHIGYWQDYVDSDEMHLDVDIFLVHRNCFTGNSSQSYISGTWRIRSADRFFHSPHFHCTTAAPIPSSHFQEISDSEADAMIPAAYQYLLSLQPPLLPTTPTSD